MLVAGACRKAPPPPPRPSAPVVPAPAPAQAAPRATETVLDAESNLMPGTESFFGFPIPRGFRRTVAVDGLFVYESTTVPIGKLRAYVATRVLTDQIEDVGTSSYNFRNASVRGGEPTDHRFDFFVASVGAAVQLRIQDIPPPEIPAGTTEEDRRRAVDRAWNAQQ